MTRRVLVPMDDSAAARAALEHALSTAPADEVVVLHAVDDLEEGYGGGSPAESDAEPDFFDDVVRIADAHDVDVETVVRRGRAAETILAYADEAGVDAIVVGSEGRSGVSRMLLGSVAEAVARRSAVPVTIVPRARRRS